MGAKQAHCHHNCFKWLDDQVALVEAVTTVLNGQVTGASQVVNDVLDCSHVLLSEVVGKLAQLGDHIDDVGSRGMCQVGQHPDCLLVWEVGIWCVGIGLVELG